jgi:hypothetical protein
MSKPLGVTLYIQIELSNKKPAVIRRVVAVCFVLDSLAHLGANTIGDWRSTVNAASVKTTFLALIGKVEDLEASQAAAIALLLGLSKGKISSSDVRHATARAKSLNKKPFDKLRKAINEISS